MRIMPLLCGWMIVSHLVAWGKPHNPKVVCGEASFQSSKANSIEVRASDRSIINWESFSIGKGEKAVFVLPGKDAAVLNRVTSLTPSMIDGLLQSNGKVYLINPNGVLVTDTGYIDTAAFIASTLDIHNGEFVQGGDLLFAGDSKQAIINKGVIQAWNGDAILIGYQVRNQGDISAPKGIVGLGAGREILIAPLGEQRITIHVHADEEFLEGVEIGVQQEGLISALKAELKADGNPYGLAVQNSGWIAAGSVDRSDGRILLVSEGGTTSNTGVLTAPGGEVQLLGKTVTLTEGALVDVSSDLGGGLVLVGGGKQGGDLSIANADYTFVEQGVHIKADGGIFGHGGDVVVWSNENTQFYGKISSRGGSSAGNGGFVEVSSRNQLGFHGSTDRTAPAGIPGTLLLDPSDITIAGMAANVNLSFGGGCGVDTFCSPGPAGTLAVSNTVDGLLDELAVGNVIIDTTAGAGGNGDIIFNDNVNWTVGANTLTLNAQRNVVFNSGFTFSNSVGSVVMNAGLLGTDGSIITQPLSTITMSGPGALTMSATNTTTTAAVDLRGAIAYSAAGGFSVTAIDGSVVVSGGGITLNTLGTFSITTSGSDDVTIGAPINNAAAGPILINSGSDLNLSGIGGGEIVTLGTVAITAVDTINAIADQMPGGASTLIQCGAGPSSVTTTNGAINLFGFQPTSFSQIVSSGGDLTVSAGEDLAISENGRISLATANPADTLNIATGTAGDGNLLIYNSATGIISTANLVGAVAGNALVAAGHDHSSEIQSTGALTLDVIGHLDVVSNQDQSTAIQSTGGSVSITASNIHLAGDSGQSATIQAAGGASNLTLVCDGLILDDEGVINLTGAGTGILTVTVNGAGATAVRNNSSIATNASGGAILSFASDLTLQGGGLGTAQIINSGTGSLSLTTTGTGDLLLYSNALISSTTGSATFTLGGNAFFVSGAGSASFAGGAFPVVIGVAGNLTLLSDDTGQSSITSTSNLSVTAGENIYIIGQPGANASLIQTSAGDLSVTATGGSLELTNQGLVQLTGGTGTLTFASGSDVRLNNLSQISSTSTGTVTGNVGINLFVVGGADGDSQITAAGALALAAIDVTGSINLQASGGAQALISVGDGPSTVAAGMSGKVNMIGQSAAIQAVISCTSPLSTLTVNGGSIGLSDHASIQMGALTTGLLTVDALNGDLNLQNGSTLTNGGTGGISSTTAAGTLYIEGGPSITGSSLIGLGSGGGTVTANGIQMVGYSVTNTGGIIATGGNLNVTASLGEMALNNFAAVALSGGGNLQVQVSTSDLILENSGSIVNSGTGTTLINVPLGELALLGGAGPAFIEGGTLGALTVATGSNIRLSADVAGNSYITTAGADIGITTGAGILAAGSPGSSTVAYVGNLVPFMMGTPVGAITISAADDITIRDNAYVSIATGGTADITLSTIAGDLNVENGSSILNSGTGSIIADMPGINANALVRAGPSGASAIQTTSNGITLNLTNGNLNIEASSGSASTISAAGTTVLTTGMLGKVNMMGDSMGAVASIVNSGGDLTITAGTIDIQDFSLISLSSTGGSMLSVTSGANDLRIENGSSISHTGLGGILNLSVAQTLLLEGGISGPSTINGSDGGVSVDAITLVMTGLDAVNGTEITATGGSFTLSSFANTSLGAFSTLQLLGGTGDLNLTVGGDLNVLNGSAIQSDSTTGALLVNVTGTALFSSGSAPVIVASSISPMASSLIAGGSIFVLSDAASSTTVSAAGAFTLQSTNESIHFIGSSSGGQPATLQTSSGNLSVLAAENITLYDEGAITITAGAGVLTLTATNGDLIVDNNSDVRNLGTGAVVASAGGNFSLKGGPGGSSSLQTASTLDITSGGNFDVEAFAGQEAAILSAGNTSFNVAGSLRMAGEAPLVRARLENSTGAMTLTVDGVTTLYPYTSILLTGGTGLFTMTLGDDFVLGDDSIIQNSSTGALSVGVAGSATLSAGAGNAIVEGIVSAVSFTTTKNLFVLADMTGSSAITSGTDLTVTADGSISVIGSIAGPNSAVLSSATAADGFLVVTAGTDLTVQDNANLTVTMGTSPLTATASSGNLNLVNNASIQNLGTGALTTSSSADILVKGGLQGDSYILGSDTVDVSAGGNIDILSELGGGAYIQASNTSTVSTMGGRLLVVGQPAVNPAYIQTTDGDLSITATSISLLDFASINILSGTGSLTINDLIGDLRVSNLSFIRNLATGATNIAANNSIFLTAGSAGDASILYTTGTLNLGTLFTPIVGNIYLQSDLAGAASIAGNSSLQVYTNQNISVNGTPQGGVALVTTTDGDLTLFAAGQIVARDNASIDLTSGLGDLSLTTIGGDIVVENSAFARTQGTGDVSVISASNLQVRSGASGGAFISGNSTMTLSAAGVLSVETNVASMATASISSNGNTSVTAGTLELIGLTPLLPATLTNSTGFLLIDVVGNTTLSPYAAIMLTGGVDAFTMNIGQDLVMVNGASVSSASTMGTLDIAVGGAANIASGSSSAFVSSSFTGGTFTAGGSIFILADGSGGSSLNFAGNLTVTSTNESIHLVGSAVGGNTAEITTSAGSLSVTAAEHITLYDTAIISLSAGAGTLTVTPTGGDLIVDNGSTIAQQGTGPIVAVVGANGVVKGGVAGDSAITTNDTLILAVTDSLDVQAVSSGAALISSNGNTNISSATLNMIGSTSLIRAQIIDTLGDLSVVTTGIATIAPHADLFLTAGTGTYSVIIGEDLILANDSFFTQTASGVMTVTAGGSAALVAGLGDAIIQAVVGTANLTATKNIWILSDSTGVAQVVGAADLTVISGMGGINIVGSIAGGNIASINNATGALTVTAANDITAQNSGSIFSSAGANTVTVTAVGGFLNLINNSAINHFGTGAVSVTAGQDLLVKAGPQGTSQIAGNSTLAVSAAGNLDILADGGGSAFITSGDTATVVATGRVKIGGNSLINTAYIHTTLGDLTVTGASFDILDFARVSNLAAAGALTINDMVGDFRLSNASIISNAGSGITNLNLASSLFVTGGADGAAALIYNSGAFNLNTVGLISFQSDLGGSAYISGGASLSVIGSAAIEIVGVGTGPSAYFFTTLGDILINASSGIVVRDNGNVDLASPIGTITMIATDDIVIENNAFVRNQGAGSNTLTTTGNLAVRAGANGGSSILGNRTLDITVAGLLDMEGQVSGGALVTAGDDTTINAGQINMRAYSVVQPAAITVSAGNLTVLAGLTTLTAHANITLTGGTGNYSMTITDDLFVSDDSSLDNFSTMNSMTLLVSGSANFSAGAGNASIFNNAPTFILTVTDFLNFIADPTGAATLFSNSASATVSARNILLSGDPELANAAQMFATGGSLTITATDNITVRDNAYIQTGAGVSPLTLTTTNGDISFQNAANLTHSGTGNVIVTPGGNCNVIAGFSGAAAIVSNADLSVTAAGKLNIEAASGNSAAVTANTLATIDVSDLRLYGDSTLVRATLSSNLGTLTVNATNIWNEFHSDIILSGGMTGDLNINATGNLLVSDDATITNGGTGPNTLINVTGSTSILGGTGAAGIVSSATNLTLTSGENLNIVANAASGSITTTGTAATITSTAGSILVSGNVTGAGAFIQSATGTLDLLANNNITVENNASVTTLAGAGGISATTTVGDIAIEDAATFTHAGTGALTLTAAGNTLVTAGRFGGSTVSSNATLDIIAGGNIELSAMLSGGVTVSSNGLTNLTAGESFNMIGNGVLMQSTVTNLTGGINIMANEIALVEWSQIQLTGGAPTCSLQTMISDIFVGPSSSITSGASMGIDIQSAANLQMTASSDGSGIRDVTIQATNVNGPISVNAAGAIIMTGDDQAGFISTASILSAGGAVTLSAGNRMVMDVRTLVQTSAGTNGISVNTSDGDLWMNQSVIEHLGAGGAINLVLLGDLVMHEQSHIRCLGDLQATVTNLLMESPGVIFADVTIAGLGSMNISCTEKIGLAANAHILNQMGSTGNLNVSAASIITITGDSGITNAGTGNLNLLGLQSLNLIGNVGDAFVRTTGGGDVTINVTVNLTATSNRTSGLGPTTAQILSSRDLSITAANIFTGGDTSSVVPTVIPVLFSSVGNATYICGVNAVLRNGARWEVTGANARLLVVTDNDFPASIGPGHFTCDQYSQLSNNMTLNNIYIYSACWGERGLPTDTNSGNGNINFGIYNTSRFAQFFSPIQVPAPVGGGFVNRFSVFYPTELGMFDTNTSAFLYKLAAVIPPPSPCPAPPPPCAPCPPPPPPSPPPPPCPPIPPCPPCPPTPPCPPPPPPPSPPSPPPRPSSAVINAELGNVIYASSELFFLLDRYGWTHWGYPFMIYGECAQGSEGCNQLNPVLRKNFTLWPIEFKINETGDPKGKRRWKGLEMQEYAYEKLLHVGEEELR